METKNGNEVKKKADPENPAVRVERSGHDVVKRASELTVEEKGENHSDEKKDDGATDASCFGSLDTLRNVPSAISPAPAESNIVSHRL